MKVAELFVELGFKVQGEDKLKGFEQSLTNAAAAATRLVVAMRMLAGLKVPPAFQQLKAIKMTGAAAPQPPVLGQETEQTSAPSGIQKGLNNISKLLGVVGLAGILKSLISALKNMVRDSLKSQFELNQFSKQTGMSREQFKKWQYLVNKVGMSQQELEQQILAMNARAFQITRGERPPSGPLAVEETADFESVIRQFEAATRNFSPRERLGFAQEYGIDPRIMTALRDFPDAFAEFEKLSTMTKQQEENVNELNTALKDLQMVLSEKVIQAFSELAPLITQVVRGFEYFLREPFKFIQQHQEGTQFAARLAAGALPTTMAGEMLKFFSDLKLSSGRGNTTVNIHGVDANNAREVGREVERVFSDNAYQSASDYFASQALFATP